MRTRTLFAAIGVIGALGLAAMPGTARAQLFDPSNWSFENGLTNWTVYEPTNAISVSTNYARTGANSLLFATTSSPVRVQYDVSSEGGVDVGLPYTGSVYYYVSAGLLTNELIEVNMTFFDAAWSPLGTTVKDIVWGPAPGYADEAIVGSWTRLEVSGTAPLGAAGIQLGMQVYGTGSSVYFDDVQVIPEPASWFLILGSVGGLAFIRRRLHGLRR